MRTVKLSILSTVVFGLFALLYYALNHSGGEVNGALNGEPVPAFELELLDGTKRVNESILTGPKYKLLNIWASWCAACKVEHPLLVSLAGQGIDIIGLNYRDDRRKALAVLASDGNPYRTVVYDPQGEWALDLGVIGAPETFVIDDKGQIVIRISGVIDEQVWQDKLAVYFK